ncbi:glycosyltransferase family 4 protein [Shewanella chilikensis]|uniref:glycosyltransferase family 4 protein n=1 Tax=Shewanella chilikensis TaxID=558541 RepID=UPI00399B41F3
MRILVLSFYYSPDLCAGSFRTSALVSELSKLENVSLDIVTTMPNRYASFGAKAEKYEQVGSNVNVTRVELPNHNSGMLDQSKAFYSYYRTVKNHVKTECYDLVFATSSRLFTAFLGAQIARSKSIPLYLDIRDIFIDTLNDVLPSMIARLSLPILKQIEKVTFNRASHINLVSKGFEEYFRSRFICESYTFFSNGIDTEFLRDPQGCGKPGSEDVISKVNKPIEILYAGNIGEGQGLHGIVAGLAARLGKGYKIKVLGDGGRKRQLVESLENSNNVELLPPVSRTELVKHYESSDILFLHLNDYPAFEKVLPSKIFEYAAVGKPILAGVSGFSAKFISEEVDNAAVFKPKDVQEAVAALSKLQLNYTNRASFVNKYTRKNIMKEMANSIVSLECRK